MIKPRIWALTAGFYASLGATSCSEPILIGRDLGSAVAGSAGFEPAGAAGFMLGGGGPSGGGGAGNGASAGATAHTCQPAACQGKVYQCGDCEDNDGDHLVDSDDPDCTGPCDNTEDSFFGGIPGQNNAPCREDCYFDQDTGSGNDHCYWSHDCDPLSVAPAYPPSGDAHCAYNPSADVPGSGATCGGLMMAQASTCLDYCLPITPNGCDCFGCCELPAGSGAFVFIGSATQKNVGTCDAAHVDDPAACHPCTPVPSCMNHCDPCEVCVGRVTPAASCSSSGSNRCPVQSAPCGQPGEADCDPGSYCVTGCCAAAPR